MGGGSPRSPHMEGGGRILRKVAAILGPRKGEVACTAVDSLKAVDSLLGVVGVLKSVGIRLVVGARVAGMPLVLHKVAVHHRVHHKRLPAGLETQALCTAAAAAECLPHHERV